MNHKIIRVAFVLWLAGRASVRAGVNSESTYDWVNDQWTVPLNAFITQLVKIGKLPISFQVGGRYYADKPAQGPNWGLRFTVTLVFPK